MGQLTASIAHEVNQPIAATVTNALAARRWLGAEPPNLDEVQQALDRIVRDGSRAGAVVGRIRNLIKKAPPSDERVDINAAIREVIELTRSEAIKNGVSVRTELAEGLPPIHRRSGRTATSDPQLDPQRLRGHERDERRVAGVADHDGQDRVGRRARCRARFGTGTGAGCCRESLQAPSTRPKRTAWGWACRSAVRSSNRTADDCGRAPIRPAAPSFNSRCPPIQTLHRVSSAFPPTYLAPTRADTATGRRACCDRAGARRLPGKLPPPRRPQRRVRRWAGCSKAPICCARTSAIGPTDSSGRPTSSPLSFGWEQPALRPSLQVRKRKARLSRSSERA